MAEFLVVLQQALAGKTGAACKGWRLLLILFLLSGVASCTPEPQSRLRLATNQWLGYVPLYLARDLGYFAPTQIQFIELPNASAVINAFRNQAI